MLKDGKNGGNKNGLTVNNSLTENFDSSTQPIITVDIKKYQSWLDNSGLSDEEKEEFLEAVWLIVVTFVERGFGVHPLQEVCGQDSGKCAQRPKEAFDQVKSKELDKPKKDRDSRPVGRLEVE